MTEQWKPIPGFEGLYDASSLGRIRSTPGKTTSNARYPVRKWKTRIMKEKSMHGKYRQDLRITLWKDGKCSDHLVARLVASAWIGQPDDGMTVNHINGDWADNRPGNLEWTTLSENIKHGFRSGLYDSICIKTTLVGSDGTSYSFRSMSEAARFLGRTSSYVSDARKKGKYVLKDTSGKEFTATF